MFKSIEGKALRHQALVLISLLLLAVPSYGAVIFEENFDEQADWNTGNQYDAQECSVGNCNASWYPTNWDAFRNMKGSSSFTHPPVSIGSMPDGSSDHTNSTSNKKALIIYNESNTYNPGYWAGDGNLIKYFGPSANYKELYVRMWMKTQANWQVQSTGTVQSKVFRTSHWRPDGDNIFQVANENSPIFFWDWGAWNGQAIYMPAYRCDATPYVASGTTQGRSADYYCDALDTAHNFQKGDYGQVWSSGGPTTKFADGAWHRYDIHLKMNDIGAANGVLEWSYDGQLVLSHYDMIWKEPSASADTGWNNVWFGGNSNNAFGNYVDQWYAIDDIVVSTTAIPDTYTIGGSTADMSAPAASISSPAGNAVISGTYSVAASASDNVGVIKVEFYVNGVLQATDTASPYLFSWNTTSLSNGSYTLSVKAYDAAGNVGQSSAVTVTVNNVASDTTPPATSITSPANGATVSGNVTVAASATDNVGVSKVEFYDNGSLSAVVNAAPYSLSWNTALVSNGSHALISKAYDAAGNVGQSAAVTVTVNNDATAPTVAISSPAAGATISGTATISATASDNVGVSKVEFYVNGSLKAVSTAAPYNYAWNTASVANGSDSLLVKAYDAAGNVGQSSASVTVNNPVADTTAPTVAISSPANSATVTGTATVTVSATDNVGVSKVEFYVNGALQATDTASPYTFSWNTTAVANGSYTLTAKAYDAAGNVGQSSSSVAVNNPVADTTAPTVAISSPAAGATVSGTATISATASDNVGVSKVEFYVNGVLKATDTASPYSYAWNTTAVANGSYTLLAKAYDAAGNVGQSSASVTVNNPVADTTVPTVAISSPAASATVSGTATISATASDNVGVSKVEFYVNGVLKATDTASPYSYAWNTTAVANGSYTLLAKAYDAAGNVGQSSSVSVAVNNGVADTKAPTVIVTSPAAGATVSGTATISAAVSDNVGVSKVEFYVNGVLKATDTAYPYSYAWNTTAVANGSYTLLAKAYDAAGNVGQSSSVSVTVKNTVADTIAPSVSIISPTAGSKIGTYVTIKASASDNVGVTKMQLYIDGVLKSTSTGNYISWTWNSKYYAYGSHVIKVTAYDAANNSRSVSISVTK